MSDTRRDFIKKTVAGTVGLAAGSSFMSARASGYRRIMGSNDRIGIAVIGVNSRGSALARTFANQSGVDIKYICDVDTSALEKTVNLVNSTNGQIPKGIKDFRTILDDKNLGAIVIAMPDHWHAYATILGCQAGKHVYVEKPLSHNPLEGELAVKAAEKYNRIVQIGTQRRSWPVLTQGIQELKEGVIGRVYMAKAWYANTRGSIGIGKQVPVPQNLDYELWQGPAPRKPYKDNLIHYNWHWFWNWGTGESLNNGTHHIDLIRWGLGVDYPLKVSSTGGRYHYKDDWEFYDTLVANFEYKDKLITWECLSCQGKQPYGRGRGVTIHGTAGTVLLDRDGYELYDLNDKKMAEFKIHSENTTLDLQSRDAMTNGHFVNFIDGIRLGTPLNSAISLCNPSVAMLQIANIAWYVKKTLELDPQNGHIRTEGRARSMWRRKYEKGWEPVV